MVIAHLIFSMTIGGAETMLVDIINQQVKYANVTLIVINNEINEGLLSNIDSRVDVVLLKRKPNSKNPLPFVNLNYKLSVLNPEVIHAHNDNMIGCLLPNLRSKTVLTVHDTKIDISSLHKYKTLYAISKSVKNQLQKLSSADSILIYNGVDPTQILYKEHYDRTSEIFKIVLISRLNHEKKGQNVLINALKILVDKGISNISVDLIGEGSSMEYLKNLTRQLGIDDKVGFKGLKDRAYIYKNLKDYHLLVQPSFYEGFGLTIVEAMMAKIPILVSDIEGPMEVIQDGKYGYFFPTGNHTALADMIEKIMNEDVKILQAQIDTQKTYAIQNFNIEKTAMCYINLY
jgi:glycosyltransferase involved in cell wall biosynthesis